MVKDRKLDWSNFRSSNSASSLEGENSNHVLISSSEQEDEIDGGKRKHRTRNMRAQMERIVNIAR